MVKINILYKVHRFLFKRTKRIRVGAKPSFLCLRRGFVQQQKLLTTKGIYASRHSPFISIIDLIEYINLSLKNENHK